MNKLIGDIKENSISYGSIPFWSWNDKLKSAELKKQIKNMKELNMNGFFMHARCGLETEYMSSAWFNAIKTCVKEAKKLGMQAWAYDENGWPSGFAGGKLLKDSDNFALYLKHEFSDKFPENSDNILAVYAVKGSGKPQKVDFPVDFAEKYLTVRCFSDSSYVDTLRDDITEKFIKETHERYKKVLGDDFGKAMPGFFTDEPQYYRYATPYSKFMDKWFNEEYGYSVFDALPAVFMDFDGYRSYLYDYNKMLHTKFMSNFAKKIYDYAEKNGIQITGHGIEESSLTGQMMCCGSVMPFYMYQHIPGIDYLGRGLQTPMSSKQLGSVCEQLGKKKALSEMFACCGWDVSPSELKHIAELQYTGGVNVMCQHLYPYSERGQRKRDYPAHYSEHSTWQDKLADFDTYFNNLGYLLSRGKECADILVIHPIHSAWLDYRRENDSKIRNLSTDFNDLFIKLSRNQIDYHFGEETVISLHGRVDGNKFIIGNCSYGKVILPALDTLDKNTVQLLKEFSENGGEIFTYKKHLPAMLDGKPAPADVFSFLENKPDLADTEVFENLKNSSLCTLCDENGNNIPEISSMYRDTEYGKVYFFTNLSDKKFTDSLLKIRTDKNLAALDLHNLTLKPLRAIVKDGLTEILLDFDSSREFAIIENDTPYLPFSSSKQERHIRLSSRMKIKNPPENMLTLDRAAVSFDGKIFTDIRPLEQIRDNLLYQRFSGNVWLKFSFVSRFRPETLYLAFEKPGVISVSVNGNELNISEKTWWDENFSKTDISAFVKKGINNIVIKMDYRQNEYVYHVLYGNVMESLRNCLNFDTEIECCYLIGDFAVKTDKKAFKAADNNAFFYPASAEFELIPQKKSVDSRNLTTDGYPFFSGKIQLETNYFYSSGKPTLLRLGGRYSVCEVRVNGQKAGEYMFYDSIDLAPYLKNDINNIILTVCSSNRNLLGPHHCKTAEPLSVGPQTFSFEGKWNGGKCDSFNYDYAFVRFGIDTSR